MKKFALTALCLFACTLGLAFAADDAKMSEEAMMKKWMETNAVGPQHQMLAKQAGEWDCSIKMAMGPGAPMTESKGSCTTTMMHGGRVVSESFRGDMMGMPFEGHGMAGYDNFNKVYWSTWTDNMSTALMYMEGTSTDGGKTIVFNTTMDEPVMEIKDKPVRMIARWVDDNTRVFESWDEIGTPHEFKAMEITYTRKK